ncbi:pyridoxal phosphate-dependent transferase [Haematococcus lacustris]
MLDSKGLLGPEPAEREQFLRTNPSYGYGASSSGCSQRRRIDDLRDSEFRRLETGGPEGSAVVYLDYAGSALYSERQLQEACKALCDTLLVNPHSGGPAGSASHAAAAELRRLTLAMCQASTADYAVVLCSGATAGLKLVSESFPWSPASQLVYGVNSHNSVLGMRETALAAGASVQAVVLEQQQQEGEGQQQEEVEGEQQREGRRRQTGEGQGQQQQLGETQATGLGIRMRPVGVTMRRLPPCPSAPPPPSPLPADPWQQPLKPPQPLQQPQPFLPEPVQATPGLSLLVMPHECNFTGQRLDLGTLAALVGRERGPLDCRQHQVRGQQQQQGGQQQQPGDRQQQGGQQQQEVQQQQPGRGDGQQWLLLLDAAKSCATAPPDLSSCPADFVVMSYYKVFGYPTGLGALLVRRCWLPLLTAQRPYWGGGTLDLAVADQDICVRRTGVSGLEDGTPAFTSIAAALHGFNYLNRLGGWAAVDQHTSSLAAWLEQQLRRLRHGNGQAVVQLYGRKGGAAVGAEAAAGGAAGGRRGGWGPTLAFNLRRGDGSWVGCNELRTGCFCNPGACAWHLGLSAAAQRLASALTPAALVPALLPLLLLSWLLQVCGSLVAQEVLPWQCEDNHSTHHTLTTSLDTSLGVDSGHCPL